MSTLGQVDAAVLLTDIARLIPIHTEVKTRYREIDGTIPKWVDNYVYIISTIRYRAIKAPLTLSIQDCDDIAAVEAGLRRDLNILTIMEKASQAMEPTA